MNDPRVVALIYRIEHGDSIDYSQARPLVADEPRFHLSVEDMRARFAFKVHYATVEQARDAIADYIRVWEFDATLRRGNPDSFRLRFEKADIVDLNPTPGAVRLSSSLVAGVGIGSAHLTVSTPNYPSPPSDLTINPDAETMYGRYMGHRQKREPLPGMAYFCLTVLQAGAGGRKAAARKYGIDISVLAKIGDLTANRGGAQARKAGGVRYGIESSGAPIPGSSDQGNRPPGGRASTRLDGRASNHFTFGPAFADGRGRSWPAVQIDKSALDRGWLSAMVPQAAAVPFPSKRSQRGLPGNRRGSRCPKSYRLSGRSIARSGSLC